MRRVSTTPTPGNMYAFVLVSTRNDTLLPDSSAGLLPPFIANPVEDEVWSWIYNDSLRELGPLIPPKH